MVLDNVKALKAAAKAIPVMLRHADVKYYFSGVGTQWTFNLPKAPWWGGLFEWLIDSTKRCLRKVIGQARLSYDELLTALIEVEAVMNSRPLSYVTANDLDKPLTPSHLLTGHRILSLPDYRGCECEEPGIVVIEHDRLTKRARYLNTMIDHFWDCWRQEYFLELREAHRYHHSNANQTPFTVGNVVVVHPRIGQGAFGNSVE